ncbi:MAG: NAD(P)H-hydrate dehydratase [Rhodospirillum sp.]|nr:NAD(P)H-hydrate dehydratase [Rhodospirillum sp.]
MTGTRFSGENPLYLLDVARMGAADRAALAAGVPGVTLMEAAGWAVAREIRARWARRPVLVLRGPGNNGGDGYVVARLLARKGWPVRLMGLGDPARLTGDAAVMRALWDGPEESLDPSALDPDRTPKGTLVVDALFGAGLARPLEGLALETVTRLTRGIEAGRLTCVAEDMPSGPHGDTGRILGAAAPCALTVTFFRPKPGHLLHPGRDLLGDLVVADIGIPDSVLGSLDPDCAANTPGLWVLPRPGTAGHKYDRGHAVVMGGARMTGAARLAARGARRVGAGLLTIACAEAAFPLYAGDQPGAMVWSLDTDGGVEALLADSRKSTYLIGPGHGRGAMTADLALTLARSGRGLVLDADALTSLSGRLGDLRAALSGPCVVTPHDGEWAALFGGEGADPGADRLTRARDAARAGGMVVLLKGPDTVIAAPDGRAAIAANAPPDLATAGSGDVLAGMVTGLLAQGLPAFEAACAGVWLHGAAGQVAGPGLIAEDLPEALPRIFRILEERGEE